MPRSSQQISERRERILAAARSIIMEAAYAGLSMRSLAENSRVTIPTIYNLIGTKDAVAFAVVAELLQGFTSRLGAQDAVFQDPAVDRFRETLARVQPDARLREGSVGRASRATV